MTLKNKNNLQNKLTNLENNQIQGEMDKFQRRTSAEMEKGASFGSTTQKSPSYKR